MNMTNTILTEMTQRQIIEPAKVVQESLSTTYGDSRSPFYSSTRIQSKFIHCPHPLLLTTGIRITKFFHAHNSSLCPNIKFTSHWTAKMTFWTDRVIILDPQNNRNSATLSPPSFMPSKDSTWTVGQHLQAHAHARWNKWSHCVHTVLYFASYCSILSIS